MVSYLLPLEWNVFIYRASNWLAWAPWFELFLPIIIKDFLNTAAALQMIPQTWKHHQSSLGSVFYVPVWNWWPRCCLSSAALTGAVTVGGWLSGPGAFFEWGHPEVPHGWCRHYRVQKSLQMSSTWLMLTPKDKERETQRLQRATLYLKTQLRLCSSSLTVFVDVRSSVKHSSGSPGENSWLGEL